MSKFEDITNAFDSLGSLLCELFDRIKHIEKNQISQVLIESMLTRLDDLEEDRQSIDRIKELNYQRKLWHKINTLEKIVQDLKAESDYNHSLLEDE